MAGQSNAPAPDAPAPGPEVGVDANFDMEPGYVVLTVQAGRLALPISVSVPTVALKGIAAQLLWREVQATQQARIVLAGGMTPPS